MTAARLLAEPKARSSTGVEPNDSFGCSLNRWHWQIAAPPRVPNTAWMSSQVASFAGTTVISEVGCGVGHERRRLFRSIGAYDDG